MMPLNKMKMALTGSLSWGQQFKYSLFPSTKEERSDMEAYHLWMYILLEAQDAQSDLYVATCPILVFIG
jgi:hypothetical protein